MIMDIKNELYEILKAHGAVLCGVGDMSDIVRELGDESEFRGMTVGISVAVPVKPSIVKDLQTAPTLEYKQEYDDLNAQLDKIVKAGADFLKSRGYNAKAISTDTVSFGDDLKSAIPHKTFATRAGLGWIGKSCLLITKEYGASVRISSILTDAPLPFDEPINQSLCGDCRICVEACPAQALRGTLWTAGMPREEIVDAQKCLDKQLEIMERETGVRTDLCGKCFAVCPYVIKRLNKGV